MYIYIYIYILRNRIFAGPYKAPHEKKRFVKMTSQHVALTPRENNFRSVSPKALRTTTSEVVLLLGQKKLGKHIVVVVWAVKS